MYLARKITCYSRNFALRSALKRDESHSNISTYSHIRMRFAEKSSLKGQLKAR